MKGRVKAIEKGKSEWRVTDPDCLQCVRVLSESERTYELVQINDYTYIEKGYRVAHGVVCLDRYSRTEIEEFLKFYSYASLHDFTVQNGAFDWSLVAEMVFETEAARYEVIADEKPYCCYDEAGKIVEKITGMNLRDYYL